MKCVRGIAHNYPGDTVKTCNEKIVHFAWQQNESGHSESNGNHGKQVAPGVTS